MTTSNDYAVSDWDGYIGQERLKRQLAVKLDAAYELGHMPDHIALCGPPGTGKTNLARLIAQRLHEPFFAFTMPEVSVRELINFIDQWHGGVLLLDEFHAAPKPLQEAVMRMIYDGKIVDGYRVIKTTHVTFVLATTERHSILPALLTRCKTQPRFEDYTTDELGLILLGMADKIGVDVGGDLAEGLAQAAGGCPRYCEGFVTAVRDLKHGGIDPTVADVLDLLDIDEDGLTADMREYLKVLGKLGARAGIDPISNLLGLSKKLVVSEIEPMLIHQGLIVPEANGRTLTHKGAAKLPQRVEMSPTERRRMVAAAQ